MILLGISLAGGLDLHSVYALRLHFRTRYEDSGGLLGSGRSGSAHFNCGFQDHDIPIVRFLLALQEEGIRFLSMQVPDRDVNETRPFAIRGKIRLVDYFQYDAVSGSSGIGITINAVRNDEAQEANQYHQWKNKYRAGHFLSYPFKIFFSYPIAIVYILFISFTHISPDINKIYKIHFFAVSTA